MKKPRYPRGVSLFSETVNGFERWRAQLGKRITGGKLVRRVFTDKQDAVNFLDTELARIKKEGTESSLRGTSRADAVRALAVLEGIPNITLEETARFWMKHNAPAGGSVSLKEMCDRYLSSRRSLGRKDRYIKELVLQFKRIQHDLGNGRFADITREDILRFLNKKEWAGKTRNGYLSTCRSLWAYGIKENVCGVNVAANIEESSTSKEQVTILSIVDTMRLVKAAEAHDTEWLLMLVIGLFAGIRRAEILELKWADVDFENGVITVSGANAKTRSFRNAEMPDNLKAFLLPYRRNPSDKVIPFNSNVEAHRRQDLLAKIGWKKGWEQNVCRHSCASYLLVKSKDQNRVALSLGHTPEMLFAHYRNPKITDKLAAQYFEIRPSAEEKVINFSNSATGT